MNTTKTRPLTPRQSTYMQTYADPDSSTFGNSYKSALSAGYSNQTARNLSHLNPEWRSENIGQMAVISPDDIMRELTAIINNGAEPTIVRLKGIEMCMKAYSMMVQREEQKTEVVNLNLNLSSTS